MTPGFSTLVAGLSAALSVAAPSPTFAQRAPPPLPPRPPVTAPPLDTARRDVFAEPARRTSFGTLDGVVTDSNLVPIPSVSVTILSSSVHVETGDNGRFRIMRVPTGAYVLIVRRLGFRPVSQVIQVGADETLRLAYELERIPQTLGAVTVTEERRSFRMMEFEYRKKLGFGEFMSQADIERHNLNYVTDLMRFFHSIGVRDGGKNSSDHYAVVRRGMTSLSKGPCSTTVMIDGMVMPSPFSLDLLPSPHELAGIEVYAGPATAPMEYATYERGCGLIIIWTKDGA